MSFLQSLPSSVPQRAQQTADAGASRRDERASAPSPHPHPAASSAAISPHTRTAASKLRRPLRPYLSLRDHHAPAASCPVVAPCPVNLLVRVLQQNKAREAERDDAARRQAKAKQQAEAAHAEAQQAWAQTSVKRQAITVSVHSHRGAGDAAAAAAATAAPPETPAHSPGVLSPAASALFTASAGASAAATVAPASFVPFPVGPPHAGSGPSPNSVARELLQKGRPMLSSAAAAAAVATARSATAMNRPARAAATDEHEPQSFDPTSSNPAAATAAARRASPFRAAAAAAVPVAPLEAASASARPKRKATDLSLAPGPAGAFSGAAATSSDSAAAGAAASSALPAHDEVVETLSRPRAKRSRRAELVAAAAAAAGSSAAAYSAAAAASSSSAAASVSYGHRIHSPPPAVRAALETHSASHRGDWPSPSRSAAIPPAVPPSPTPSAVSHSSHRSAYRSLAQSLEPPKSVPAVPRTSFGPRGAFPGAVLAANLHQLSQQRFQQQHPNLLPTPAFGLHSNAVVNHMPPPAHRHASSALSSALSGSAVSAAAGAVSVPRGQSRGHSYMQKANEIQERARKLKLAKDEETRAATERAEAELRKRTQDKHTPDAEQEASEEMEMEEADYHEPAQADRPFTPPPSWSFPASAAVSSSSSSASAAAAYPSNSQAAAVSPSVSASSSLLTPPRSASALGSHPHQSHVPSKRKVRPSLSVGRRTPTERLEDAMQQAAIAGQAAQAAGFAHTAMPALTPPTFTRDRLTHTNTTNAAAGDSPPSQRTQPTQTHRDDANPPTRMTPTHTNTNAPAGEEDDHVSKKARRI